MRRALGRHPHQAAALQDRLGPGVAESKPVLGHQRLVEVLHSEIPVTRPVLLDDELDLVHRRAPPRYPAAPPPPHNSIVPRDSAPVPRYTSPSVPRVASRSPGLELLQKPDRSSATRTGHIICYRQDSVLRTWPQKLTILELTSRNSRVVVRTRPSGREETRPDPA